MTAAPAPCGLPAAARARCLHGMTQQSQPKNPLHGITLEMIVNELVARHGWAELGRRIEIRCFTHDPSVKSSLTFLRKTPWARKKVEDLYLAGKR